jgi:lipoprotein-anchoring transpeptidase ErfK/SrfK
MKRIIATLAFFVLLAGTALAQQEELSFERKQAIDSLALEKVRDLSKYIKIVGSKETAWSEANRVIDRAEELFMSNAEIGVSSIASNNIKYYKVRPYFEHLMRLNYDRVEIEWYNIEYVSDLQRQPDGTYVGVITIFQTFRGYDKEGNLAYKDTTKKDITVYVKRKETQIGGRMIGFWDVLLGDMRVKETANK